MAFERLAFRAHYCNSMVARTFLQVPDACNESRRFRDSPVHNLAILAITRRITWTPSKFATEIDVLDPMFPKTLR